VTTTGPHPPAGPSAPPGALMRIARGIGLVELTIGGVTLLMIFVFVLWQALQRYLPLESIAWTGELSRFSLIWLTFSAMGVLITSHGHIALELVDTIRRPMVVRIIQVFALLVVAVTAVGLTREAANLVATQAMIKSPVLRMPMSWVYIPVLVGSVSTLIRSVIAAVVIALRGPVIADIDADADAMAEIDPGEIQGEGVR